MYRLNLESLVFRLPVEVLMMIFREFKPDQPHEHSSLFNPLLVCRTWYDIIIGSPQLWGVVNGCMPLNLARFLIHRTQPHPISIDWPPNGPFNGQYMLNLFTENSMRIRRINVYASRWSVTNRPNLRRLLEAPTPVLEVLEVKVEPVRISSDGPSGTAALNTFVLSEGLPLKHLSLCDVTTPLESPRLFNLITLALRGSAVPRSPQSLLRALSSLLRLEALDIRALGSSTGNVESSTSVTLPHLKELILSEMPSTYVAAILASIHTPLCSHMEVQDRRSGGESPGSVEALDAVIWGPGNNLATVLAGGIGSKPTLRRLDIYINPGQIEIKSNHAHHGSYTLEFARADGPQLTTLLGTAFSQLPSGPTPGRQSIFTSEPIDLLPWSERLGTLVARDNSCRSVLQQLSQQHPISGTGEMDWICPKLSVIFILFMPVEEDTALDEELLLSLVRHRWSGDEGLAAATQPEGFEVVCERKRFPNLWSFEDEIKRVVPSFRLRGFD